MVTPMQLDIIQSLVDDAVANGAKLVCGGKRNPNLKEGLFYMPTVLTDVRGDMRIAQEEVGVGLSGGSRGHRTRR